MITVFSTHIRRLLHVCSAQGRAIAPHIRRRRTAVDVVLAVLVVAALAAAANVSVSAAAWSVQNNNQLQYAVTAPDPASFTTFSPNDGRVGARAGDRVAIWCNIRSLDIWGISNNGTGFRLARFTLREIILSNSPVLVQNVEPNGTVTLRINADDSFTISWTGGPFGANGQGDFVKTITCL